MAAYQYQSMPIRAMHRFMADAIARVEIAVSGRFFNSLC
jgi:hypothetical protein